MGSGRGRVTLKQLARWLEGSEYALRTLQELKTGAAAVWGQTDSHWPINSTICGRRAITIVKFLGPGI